MDEVKAVEVLLQYIQLEAEFYSLIKSLREKARLDTLPSEMADAINQVTEAFEHINLKRDEFLDAMKEWSQNSFFLGIIAALGRLGRLDLLYIFPEADKFCTLRILKQAEDILRSAYP